MTTTMHHSREIWGPNADDFDPDRWLAPDGQSLDQYMCAFSKGARDVWP
jgi:cytochrome P450